MQMKYVCSMFVVQAEDNERREKNLEEAKKITIENDPSLPDPEAVSLSHLKLFLLYCYISPNALIGCWCKSSLKPFFGYTLF